MVQTIRTIPVLRIIPEKDIYPKNYTLRTLPLREIIPSPFQHRKDFDTEKLIELAQSIIQDSLISPILVRPVGKRFELIAGERRFRAIRDYTDSQTIEAKVIEIDALGARRLSAAENLQREDLTLFETIEAIVEIVDAELIDDGEYVSMGEGPVDRVKALLARLRSITNSKDRGSQVSREGDLLLRKFAQQVENIFHNLPKPLEWRSFYRHDLPLLLSTCKEVQNASIEHNLNKSQTTALEKLKKVSEDQFKRLAHPARSSEKIGSSSDSQYSTARNLSDFSAVEIDAIAEKEMRRQVAAEQGRSRETYPLSSKAKALLMNRLGIPLNAIAAVLKIKPNTAAKYCKNDRLFQSVRKSLEDGFSVAEAAGKHGFPEPLVWSFALEGKDDAQRFKILNWGLRTWDVWNLNECDKRFGDDWSGRIPAQMIAHILYYYSDQEDLVFDPMAGGGVVADTCLAFNRKCRSFDLDVSPDTRPEIEAHFWDIDDLIWPANAETKPDLIIFDPPYHKKQARSYNPDGISGFSKKAYLEFMERFFSLTHLNSKDSTRMVFINADWRDFQGIPARDESPANSIMIDDYLNIMKESGWQRVHIIHAPLSSERFTGNMVSAMQKRRTLGVISRYVIMARKAQ